MVVFFQRCRVGATVSSASFPWSFVSSGVVWGLLSLLRPFHGRLFPTVSCWGYCLFCVLSMVVCFQRCRVGAAVSSAPFPWSFVSHGVVLALLSRLRPFHGRLFPTVSSWCCRLFCALSIVVCLPRCRVLLIYTVSFSPFPWSFVCHVNAVTMSSLRSFKFAV